MNNEQNFEVTINIKSKTLESIVKSNIDLINKLTSSIKINNGYVVILSKDNPYVINVPSNDKEALKELIYIFKKLLGKEGKLVIKELKKAKGNILVEVVFDWTCIEVCSGDLAKEMSQIHKDKPDLQEAAKVDKFIYKQTYINKNYELKEEIVFKEIF